jgi:hypothetical protein
MLHLSFQILAYRYYIGKSLAVKVHDIRSFHSEHPWLEALKAALPFFWLMLIATGAPHRLSPDRPLSARHDEIIPSRLHSAIFDAFAKSHHLRHPGESRGSRTF